MRKTAFVLLAVVAGAGLLCAQSAAPVHLTLAEAVALALKNHPQVLAAQDDISVAEQRLREARSAYYPTIAGDLTTTAGNTDGRIGAGYITDSRIFDRVGAGFTVDQLVTDSGRTPNLVATSRLRANATQQNYQATRYDVISAVNNAYFDALRAQALVKVAQQTVDTRQVLVTQITTLAQNNLRSQVDVAFANVNLAQARLLLIRSQDEVQRTFAELTRALGADQNAAYDLVDQPLPPSPPKDPEMLVSQSMTNRPELASLRLSVQAATRFENAEKELSYPTVTLMGVGGYMPYINQILRNQTIPNEYAGVGFNVEVPIFNGHLFNARREAAHYETLATEQMLRNRQQQISRDVRSAWANSNTAFEGLEVAAELLRQATLANTLAQGRYDLQLASIVELTTAQLNLTSAEIESLNAKYDYQRAYAFLQYTMGLLR